MSEPLKHSEQRLRHIAAMARATRQVFDGHDMRADEVGDRAHLEDLEFLLAEIEWLRALLRPFVDMVAEPEDFAAARRALEGK